MLPELNLCCPLSQALTCLRVSLHPQPLRLSQYSGMNYVGHLTLHFLGQSTQRNSTWGIIQAEMMLSSLFCYWLETTINVPSHPHSSYRNEHNIDSNHSAKKTPKHHPPNKQTNTVKENPCVTWSPWHAEKNGCNGYCFPSRCSPRCGKYCVWNGAQGRRGPGVPPRGAPHLLHWEPAHRRAHHAAERPPLQEALAGAGGQESCRHLWRCQPGRVHSDNCQVQLCQPGMSSVFLPLCFFACFLTQQACQTASVVSQWKPGCVGQCRAISVRGEWLHCVTLLTISSILLSLGGIVASQLLFSELFFSSCSVAQSGPTLCDPMDFPVLYSLLEFAQTHVHWVGDALQPSHPLSPSSPLALRTFMGDQPWANDCFLASPFLCLYFSQSFLAVQESYLLESLFSALTQKHLKCIHTLRNKYLNQSQVSFLP